MAGWSKGWLSEINIGVYLMILVFSWSCRIHVQSIMTEVPLMVNKLPEGWDLPSYVKLITECSKLGLVAYVAAKQVFQQRCPDWLMVYCVLVAGTVGMFLIGLFWQDTMPINGTEHSIPLMAILAAMTTMTNMAPPVFLNYISRYKAQYLTAFFVGEGMSSLMPALLSMAQGMGDAPVCINFTIYELNASKVVNYSANRVAYYYPAPTFPLLHFCVGISCLTLCSGVAFVTIHHVTKFRKEYSNYTTKDNKTSKRIVHAVSKIDEEKQHLLQQNNKGNAYTLEQNGTLDKVCESSTKKDVFFNSQEIDMHKSNLIGRCEFVLWIFLLSLGCSLMYGVLPGLKSYACLPYGQRAYNLAVRIAYLIVPIASFLSLFCYTSSTVWILVINLMGWVCSIYQIVLATQSPWPILKGTSTGEALVILSTVCTKFFFTYSHSCIAYILKDRGGPLSLMYMGLAMMAGPTFGAIITFVLVTQTDIFVSESTCSEIFNIEM